MGFGFRVEGWEVLDFRLRVHAFRSRGGVQICIFGCRVWGTAVPRRIDWGENFIELMTSDCKVEATPACRLENSRSTRVRLLHKKVQRFRGGLVLKAHRLSTSLKSRL